VRARREFLAIQRDGRRIGTRHFLVMHRLGTTPVARLGITVTRKIGGSVTRNRVKRAVRETFRKTRTTLPAGVELVVIARNGSGELGSAAIADEIGGALASLARTGASARRKDSRE